MRRQLGKGPSCQLATREKVVVELPAGNPALGSAAQKVADRLYR